MSYEIKAEVHSDDYNIKVDFDARNWFEQATDQQIIDLADCDWGGDYPSDDVAEFMAESNPAVKKLFDYLDTIRDDHSKKDCNGFECHVDEDSAMTWLHFNNPSLAKELRNHI